MWSRRRASSSEMVIAPRYRRRTRAASASAMSFSTSIEAYQTSSARMPANFRIASR